MADTPKHSVSVAGIVVDDQDRVLVIQRRDNGHWEPPGGVLELGESFEVGVMREVLEETGVKVQVDQLTGAYKNLTAGVVALVFRCSATGGLLRETGESAKVKWIRASEVSALMDEAYAVRVLDALDATGARTRIHDGKHLLPASTCD